MSILGYSSAYFLPEYWASTPLYGEKIIPLLDYILSTDFAQADKLANAFYVIQNKYKNTSDLPIDMIKAIIDESGYTYVSDLLGEDEDSIRLLVYLLVLIHQLKGTKLGIEVVLNLLKRDTNPMVLGVIGNPTITQAREVTDFTTSDYVLYNGFTTDAEPFELTFPIRTGNFNTEQCIASSNNYGFYLNINTRGELVLSLGSKARNSWDIVNRAVSKTPLLTNTSYYIKLSFDGFSYNVKVSTDNLKYAEYIFIESNVPLDIHSGIIYLGVNGSEGNIEQPFNGFIDLAPFSMDVQNITILQWFEQFPVGDENTFIIKAELDLGILSEDFFSKFAIFVSKYVYPTLGALEAKLNFNSNLTFLPYCRQRVTYVAGSSN